jgi:hypothetical protein
MRILTVLTGSGLYLRTSGEKRIRFFVHRLLSGYYPRLQFARIVENVERIRELQMASGIAIEGLSEGMMQRAFRGEFTGPA